MSRDKAISNSSMTMRARDSALINRNEALEVAARRRHYQEKLQARHSGLLRLVKRATCVGVPMAYISFVIIYFVVGFSHYNSEHEDKE